MHGGANNKYMKKSKIMLLSLLAIGTIGLASCQGEQGIKGETGDQGLKGVTGDTGTPGKDGNKGSDGNSFLTGEGAPSDSLGIDGDTYLDLSSDDLYTRESGKWSKVGNIKGDKGDVGEDGDQGKQGETGDPGTKGETGDKGETGGQGDKGDKGDQGVEGDKGETGKSGATGAQGATAWSCTVVPRIGGRVEVSTKTESSVDYFVFKMIADDGYKFSKLYLDDENVTSGVIDLTYTAKVVENGYVVMAEFVVK